MGTQEMPEYAFMNVVQRISLVEKNYLDMLDATRIKVNSLSLSHLILLLCILFHLRIVTNFFMMYPNYPGFVFWK